MTIRRLTNIQFSPGTSIDGNRLDRAMQDVVDRYNAIQPGDMSKRHTQHQVVLGWSPACFNGQPKLPFLPMYNSPITVVTGTASPDEGQQNPWRAKGTYNPNIDPTTNINTDYQWLWTTSLGFTKPVILDGVSVFMLWDSSYTNNFMYGAHPPPGKVTGQAVDDLFLEVSVDNPFLQENRSQNSIEYHKTRWKVDAEQFTANVIPGGFNDMYPIHPAGPPKGIAVNSLGLNIPLPQAARVRFSMGIPEYRVGYESSWQGPGRTPWDGCVYSVVLTFLDSLESA